MTTTIAQDQTLFPPRAATPFGSNRSVGNARTGTVFPYKNANPPRNNANATIDSYNKSSNNKIDMAHPAARLALDANGPNNGKKIY